MNMLKGEWKSIISKPMNILIIVGLLFVPFLYNVIFLSAYWDPYGKTDQIPVAVVNEDKGATLDGKELHVGDDFVENLKDNDTFDWRFTNKEEALEGLKDEKYYLVLELPSNFSENATTLMDEDPKKMKFVYHTNAGKNYSGAQIGSNAVTKINEQIKEEVTKQYAETVFDSFKEVADGLQEASDGAGKIEDGSKTLRDNLKKLADSTVTFEEGVTKLASGISDANKGAKTINENQVKLASGLGELTDAGGKLETASGELKGGAVAIDDGLNQLEGKLPAFVGGLNQLEQKLPEFVSGLNEANTKVNEVAKKIEQKKQEINAVKEKIDSAQEAFDTRQQQIVNSINENENIPDEEKQKLIDEITKLSSEQFMEQQQAQVNELKAQVDQVQVLADGLKELSAAGGQIQGAVTDLSDASKQIQSGVTELSNGATKLASGQEEFNKNFTTFNDKLGEASEGANKLAEGTKDLVSGLGELDKGGSQLVSGTKELEEGSGKLYDGSSELAEGTSELHSSLQEGANDAKEVNPNDKTYSMFASPTDLQDDKQNNVDKYGVGLTPYILCIGLFAGALMFSSVYSLKDPAVTPTSGLAWFLSKFSVIAFMAVFQSILVATVLLWGLDLYVTSVWRFYVFTIITGLTFFTLVLFLTTALGKIGQFLTFIMLLLQIGGSSGTFPKALVPEFFQVINPFLPMTYAIRGFREIISVGDDYGFAWSQAGVLGIFALVFIILTIIVFSLNVRKFRKVNEDEEATA
ncbi:MULTISPECIES: YhgE/Pip domain-containing protein [Bacillaceae]|uniref:YhgE/Pip family protein n=1 Tax=Bacillaceae TaxID=186817 RepID=UPI001046F810|nr:YhgE/Pip domain-containing protein [Bacillus sp. CBEL-1]TDB53090.1 YhgE/Pip domain-containing protein [Bacillus sp. CBEL-1]